MPICQNTASDIPHYDLNFYVGDDDKFIFYWSTKYIDPDTQEEVKVPVDLTGYSAQMHFRNDYFSEEVIEFIVYDGVTVVYGAEEVTNTSTTPPVHTETGIITAPLTGRVEFILTQTELRLLFGNAYAKKTYIYDVQVTNTDALNRTLLLGNVTLTNDITRTP